MSARSWWPLLIGVVGALVVACGSGGAPTSRPTSSESSIAPSTGATPGSPVVGRWQQQHNCEQLLAALKANGLEKVAPAMVGDFFPKKTPLQLAKKGSHICEGSLPQSHAHFFTDAGLFGSLDQNGKQVDDGHFELTDNHVMQVNEGRFEYQVAHGVLVLKPLISAKDRKAALAAPFDFSTAGWQVSVTYGGLAWHSVPCQGWC